MKTLFHLGGSIRLEDETVASVLRYSLALAERGEMGTVTLDDLAQPEEPSQLVLVVGLGVPLSVVGIRSPEGLLDHADSGADIDQRLARLIAPRNVVADTDWEETPFDIDLHLGAA
jgi:hypothetical protein